MHNPFIFNSPIDSLNITVDVHDNGFPQMNSSYLFFSIYHLGLSFRFILSLHLLSLIKLFEFRISLFPKTSLLITVLMMLFLLQIPDSPISTSRHVFLMILFHIVSPLFYIESNGTLCITSSLNYEEKSLYYFDILVYYSNSSSNPTFIQGCLSVIDISSILFFSSFTLRQ